MTHDELEAPRCPYCGATATLVDSRVVYGRSYGKIWLCANYPECDAYVGCHRKSGEPLGRLADRELRKWKKLAHMAFDRLWQSGAITRGEAYAMLATLLNIPQADAHIGMFDVEQCRQVVARVADKHERKDT